MDIKKHLFWVGRSGILANGKGPNDQWCVRPDLRREEYLPAVFFRRIARFFKPDKLSELICKQRFAG